MAARIGRAPDKHVIEDADHSLRAASRLFPDALTPFVLKEGDAVERVEWTETQLAARQRRLDRTLLVHLKNDSPRSLHIEWTDRLNRRVQERAAEYHWNFASVALHDARTKRKHGDKNAKPVGIESMIVVLGGRKKPWGRFGVYRSSPKRTKFSGVRFRIEAVYQKTVEELERMGNVFWLGFVPLAKDVDEEKLRRVINEVRRGVNDDDYAALSDMMLSMAKLKKGVPGFIDMVMSLLKQEVPVLSFVFRPAAQIEATIEKARQEAQEKGFEAGRQQGQQQGLQEGLKEGRQEGLKEGLKEGCTEGLAPLVYLFERRLRRPLTESEQRRLVKRLKKDGPEKIGSLVLDASRTELAQWLALRKGHFQAKSRTKT